MKLDEWVNKKAMVIVYRKLNKELHMNHYYNN